MKILKTILCILFALMFINAGLNKFFNYMPVPEMTPEELKIYAAFGTLIWLMPLVGFIEILGGLLFISPKTRALGAIIILPVMVGIIIHNAVFMPGGLAISGVFLIINVWMIRDNWEKYRPMFS